MQKNTLCLTSLLLAVLVVAGCTETPRLPSGSLGSFNDAAGFTRADSIVGAVGDARDNDQRVLAVIDSLEAKGELSLAKTIFYRTITYNMMGQRRKSLRLYAQLCNISMSDLTTEADQYAYIYAYNNYVCMLCEMKRYDRALREANAADQRLRAAGYEAFTQHHDIAQTIGECQFYLGQSNLATESFKKALLGVHSRLETHRDPLDYRECQKTMNAIAKVYIETENYEQAQPWIAVQDSLYAVAAALPQCDSVFLDEMKADISYSKALVAHGQGHHDDAERAYSDYQSTRAARQLSSIINSNEYLLRTQRFAEAASNYEQLDHFLKSNGYKADFENFGLFMMPKFRANLLAGKQDSALRVATVVMEYYDSALVRQRRMDSDLLTTFYDTEGKERQIAEQRAELSQQRLFTVIAILVIFAIFVLIYTIQRRRAYQRLDATNRQLVKANERAEESSRMKTQFIQQISHEVRTPLNVLSGFSQVLANPDIEISNDELQNISHKIVENGERITVLIDKMLDLSLINSNADIECKDTVKPSEVVEQSVRMSGIIQAEHLQFRVELSPESEQLSIVTNRKSAAKALTLLLDNAVKFTHPLALQGKVTADHLQHVLLQVSCDPQHVIFTVEDTGIGVPPEEAEHIFKEFVQLDEYTDGTGIGLPIARSMARHMGGDVVLDTTYSDGARFVMTLPK